MNLLVAIAILPECDLEKLQFVMQAVLITESPGCVHQCGKYSMLVGEVLVGTGRGWYGCIYGIPYNPESHQISCKYQYPGR
jgi:hypothetical protein